MLRRRAIIVVVVPLLLLLGACGPVAEKPTPTPAATVVAPKAAPTPQPVATPKPAVEKPQRGGTLTFAVKSDAGELDPHKVTIGYTRGVSQLMFNTLVNTDEKGNIVPELAESWSYPEPKTLAFKLRKGVKFHDGTDFNAEAVKFNFERLLDPATKALRRLPLLNIRLAEVVDEHTVKLHLNEPEPALLAVMVDPSGSGMWSPAGVKKWGAETLTHPVGTGPFELVEWVKGDHLTVKRFDGYWRKDEDGNPLPYLDRVIFKTISDEDVKLTNLRTGAVDVIDEVSPVQLATVRADRNLKAVDWGSFRFTYQLNCARPPFKNIALRQAVAWAIDREAINKAIYYGRGVPGQYYIDPSSWAFDPTGKFYTRDLAKAREKLAEGGKPNGFKFVLKVYNLPLDVRLAQAVKGQLAEVGIDAEVLPLESRQLSAEGYAGEFEARSFGGSGFGADPAEQLNKAFLRDGSTNTGKCGTPELDELLEKAQGIGDQAERKALYAKAQALAVEESGSIFLLFDRITSAMLQKVMGFRPQMDQYSLQFDWIWLKK